MRITEATAYTADIAHTYIVRGRLEQATRKLRYICRIETQGNIGIKEQLTPEEVQETDMIILAIDVKISGENRFKGKPMVRMNTKKAMKDTGAMLQNIEEALTKRKDGGN